MKMGFKGKGGKEVLKDIDEWHGHFDKDGTYNAEVITTKSSRIKKRNVSLQHFDDNWDKIFKK